MFQTREEIRASLLEAGVSAARAAELSAKAKPCVWLETSSVDDERVIPLGATKIGGRPDLPHGMTWPYRPPYAAAEKWIADAASSAERIKITLAEARAANSSYAMSQEQLDSTLAALRERAALSAQVRPLSFIAQLDFAELDRVDELDRDIPRVGRLLFFFDAEQQLIGFDSAGWDLSYNTAASADLIRADPPQDLISSPERTYFEPLECASRFGTSIVPLWGYDYPIARVDDPDHDAFADWYFKPLADVPHGFAASYDHRVGGHPHQIQNDMQFDLQLIASGLSLTPENYHGVTAEKMRAGGKDWVLLLQISSDDKNGMLWGDSGNLYVWIRRDDLRARRFEKAWVILQCY
jgi:uncharacterized protein YwqG